MPFFRFFLLQASLTAWRVLLWLLVDQPSYWKDVGVAGFQSHNEVPDSGHPYACVSYSQVYGTELRGICVCTELLPCPELPSLSTTNNSHYAVQYTTSKLGKRLEPSVLEVLPTRASRLGLDGLLLDDTYVVVLDPSVQSQSILGFGGALTDASAINLYKLAATLQEQVLQAYFGKGGLRYSAGRIPIASTDFSTYIYSYNDKLDDFAMANFSIQTDLPPYSTKIPMIQRILEISNGYNGNTSSHIWFVASSWAPPAWMTVQNSTLNCNIKGEPGKSPYWSAWALYYSKFITEYAARGITIHAVTTQNEPVRQPLQLNEWQSLRFDHETERDWIKEELGPRLRQDHPDVQIIIYDDQKKDILEWEAALSDPESRQYIHGIGFHWYTNVDFALPFLRGDFGKLRRMHDRYPNQYLLGTEACEGFLPPRIGTGAGVRIEEFEIVWQRAENYARDIIGDLQNYAVGWIDWNILLDGGGGPNWAENFVDAPVLVDGVGGQEYYLQPTYFVMGHFSRFLPRGSVRIEARVERGRHKPVEVVAFETPNHDYVLIFQYRSRRFFLRRNQDVRFRVQIDWGRFVEGSLPPDSVTSVVIPASVLE